MLHFIYFLGLMTVFFPMEVNVVGNSDVELTVDILLVFLY